MSRPSPVAADAAAPFTLGHFVAGRHVAGPSGREGPVYDPATGTLRGHVAFATADETRRRHRRGRGRAARLGQRHAAAARPRHVPVQGAAREPRRRDRADAHVRARQGALRRARRDHPRHGSRRVRLRHSAAAQERVHRERRHRRRQLVDPPAGGRVRRDHAVQFPGDGAACGCSRSRSPAATPSSSSPRRRIRAYRCASRNCCGRPGCRTGCSTS